MADRSRAKEPRAARPARLPSDWHWGFLEALKHWVFKPRVCFRSLNWTFLREKRNLRAAVVCEVPSITPEKNCEKL